MRRLGIDLSYFFTYEDEIPDGVGFSHFGPVHLLWLGVCAGLLLLFLHYYKRWGGRRRLWRREESAFSGGTGSVPDCGAGSDRENVAVSTAASPVQHGRVLCCLHAFSNGTGWDRFSIPCVCREPCLRFYSRTGCAIRRFILLRYRDLPSMPGLCST